MTLRNAMLGDLSDARMDIWDIPDFGGNPPPEGEYAVIDGRVQRVGPAPSLVLYRGEGGSNWRTQFEVEKSKYHDNGEFLHAIDKPESAYIYATIVEGFGHVYAIRLNPTSYINTGHDNEACYKYAASKIGEKDKNGINQAAVRSSHGLEDAISNMGFDVVARSGITDGGEFLFRPQDAVIEAVYRVGVERVFPDDWEEMEHDNPVITACMKPN